MTEKRKKAPVAVSDDSARHPGPVHVGAAAARILERLRRTANQLPEPPRIEYDCEQCKDTGLIPGKRGAKRCPHVKKAVAKQDTEKFF